MIHALYLFLLFILSCSPSYDYSHIKVVEVIDGDTVKLSTGQLLRYIGLDTPEIRIKKEGRFYYSPQPYAYEAKEYNRSLVEGKFVSVEFDVDKKDKYGRLLGYCFIDGVFVNAKLLEEGYAVLYTYPPNVKYVDLFVSHQKQARKHKRGMWGAYEVIEHTEAARHLNQIRTVKGRVISTYKSKNCVFLNFGRNWRTDFTVVIFNNSLDFFSQKGIDPVRYYKGKLIEVTGRIREYNGPEIIVNSPQEIVAVE
ncbi:MAG: thermonuclease family protein [Candidatus Omnitrophota bacterium]|nr:MAG: thermonuclease family protein [Candidatus Omnitrophota bacterium]